MDKIREEFEVWFNEIGSASVLADTMKDDAGNYYFPETRLLWACWQASRQALVVRLPELCDGENPCKCYYESDSIEQSLLNAGIKWTE